MKPLNPPRRWDKGLTLVEIIVVIAVLVLLTSGTWLALRNFWLGRNLETSAENLAQLIRSAQLRAKETQSVQMILFTETSVIWKHYHGKAKAEIEDKLASAEAEVVRRQEFKNEVIIEDLEFNGNSVEVPDEPVANIGILIDENGKADSATIILTKGDESSAISVGGSIVTAGYLGTLEGNTVIPTNVGIQSNEEAIIVQTEPLLARGWQIITVNNVDTVSEGPAGSSMQGKIKEVKLRVKLDSRLPESAHIHAYVFSGNYENKLVAHGTTTTGVGRTITFTGHIWDGRAGAPLAGATIKAYWGNDLTVPPVASYTTEADSYYELINLPFGVYTFEVSAEGRATQYLGILVDSSHNYLDIIMGTSSSSALHQNEQSNIDNSLGEWNWDNDILTANAIAVGVPQFYTPRLYYLYKDNSELSASFITEYPPSKTSQLYKYTRMLGGPSFSFSVTMVAANNFSNTGSSYFPVISSELDLLNGNWKANTGLGDIHSQLASQPIHGTTFAENEIKQGCLTSWLTIPMKDLPLTTKFLRIAISAYHFASVLGTSEDKVDTAFNLYPTANSRHLNEQLVESLNLDYETDPFVAVYPWLKWQNDPLWLSNYGYMLKPLTRNPSNNILAIKGPYDGEIYEGNKEYKNFWYGPIFLDWNLILGEEGILQLLGWVSGTFGFSDWQYKQLGDSYHFEHYQNHYNITHRAAPTHYWLKNFAFVSYWYLFNYTSFFPAMDVPKRIQLPLNILTQSSGEFLKIWERNICAPYPYESSSLSIPLLESPGYPVWLPSLAPVFGQNKLSCAASLYSSYFYVMQRINHIILDTAAWTNITTNNSYKRTAAVLVWIRGTDPQLYAPTGNLDRWKHELLGISDNTGYPYPRAAWWSWYSSIPWAKGVTFPIPATLTLREGWETAQVEPPPSESIFLAPLGNSNYTLNTNYVNALKSQPNTIFMSTSHYPLGIVQIAIKK